MRLLVEPHSHRPLIFPSAEAAKNTYGIITVAFYSTAIDWGLGPETGGRILRVKRLLSVPVEQASAELS
ncbi:hypothetical protein WN73_09095 [Bradyrhizobium sp. CCBAU 45394]|nr:hypothetical protein [Bradyrhizobium sp. CCBAU 45394]MDA9491117.1 hypothetical protein [Bradyrhizobium sp. CCBAU 11361]